MKVTFHPQKCAGHGVCALEAPTVFDIDEETGLALVLNATPEEGETASVRTAARGCPERAITVE